MFRIPLDQYLKDLASFNWVFPHHRVSQGNSDAVLVKGDPALFFGGNFTNKNAAFVYVKLHNTSVSPVAGSTPVTKTIGIPPGQTLPMNPPEPILFYNGLAYTIVTGLVDSDATSVVAGDVVFDLEYR